jgi:hypothetical protein
MCENNQSENGGNNQSASQRKAENQRSGCVAEINILAKSQRYLNVAKAYGWRNGVAGKISVIGERK